MKVNRKLIEEARARAEHRRFNDATHRGACQTTIGENCDCGTDAYVAELDAALAAQGEGVTDAEVTAILAAAHCHCEFRRDAVRQGLESLIALKTAALLRPG